MARSAFGNRQILLALHQRGETGDVLALSDEATGIMAGVAADIVRHDLDAALADGRGPHEIDGEPRKMRQAIVGGGAFDRTRDQRRGRTGVLMVGIPRAAGQFTRAKHASPTSP